MSTWLEHQISVIETLERHGDTLDRIAERLTKIEVDLAGLKVKASLWGLMGGFIPALGTVFLLLWKSHAGLPE